MLPDLILFILFGIGQNRWSNELKATRWKYLPLENIVFFSNQQEQYFYFRTKKGAKNEKKACCKKKTSASGRSWHIGDAKHPPHLQGDWARQMFTNHHWRERKRSQRNDKFKARLVAMTDRTGWDDHSNKVVWFMVLPKTVLKHL